MHCFAMEKQYSGKLLWSDLSSEEKDLVISVFATLRQWRDDEIKRNQAMDVQNAEREGGTLEPDQDSDNSADEL